MNNLVLITGRQYSGRHKFCNQFGTQNRYSFVFPYTTRYIEDKRIRYASDNEFNNLCLNGDIISIADMGSYRHGIPKLNFNKNLVALIDIRMIYDIVRYAKDNMKIYVIVLDKSEKERYNKYIKLKDRDYHDHVLREDMEDYLATGSFPPTDEQPARRQSSRAESEDRGVTRRTPSNRGRGDRF